VKEDPEFDEERWEAQRKTAIILIVLFAGGATLWFFWKFVALPALLDWSEQGMFALTNFRIL
jgi:hypothetical protein